MQVWVEQRNINPFYTLHCQLWCKNYLPDIFFFEPEARHLILDTFLVKMTTQKLELKQLAEMQKYPFQHFVD